MTRRGELWLGAGLAALACASYAGALGVGFFSDDYEWLGRMNATLERPSFALHVFYRDFNPALHASFMLDWLSGGGTAFAFHLQSLLLHGACSALLYAVCRRLAGQPWVAAAAVATWATNVRLSEAVIWPAARGHVLATLFLLCALLAAGGSFRGRGLLAVGAFLLGLLSKETAVFPLVAFPFLLPDWRRARGPLAGMAAAAAAFVVFKLVSTPQFHATPAPFGEVALKAPFILLRPLGLGDLYSFSWIELVAVLAAFGAVAWLLRRTVGLAGMIWVLASTTALLPLDKLSSRYLYLPAVGYAVALCGALAWLRARITGGRARRLAVIGGGLLLLLVSVANVLNIRREIGDYRLLSQPYARCVQALAGPLGELPPNQTVIVVDTGPRDTIRRLTETIEARRNMRKLIPYREHAVDGLIELPDLLNIIKPRTPGLLGYGVPAEPSATVRWIAYAPGAAKRLPGPPADGIPLERLSAARWGPQEEFFLPPAGGIAAAPAASVQPPRINGDRQAARAGPPASP